MPVLTGGKTETRGPARDCAHTRTLRSRMGIETRRALSGVRDGKNVERIRALHDQRSPCNQRANPNENLWDHVRSLRSRTFRSFSDGRLPSKCRARPDFLCARSHLHSRTQCRAKGRPTLHRRRRNGYAVVYSQTRQSIDRSPACPDATDVVPERRRAARDHHALRI